MTLRFLGCLPECAVHVFHGERPREETSVVEYRRGALLIAVDFPGTPPERDSTFGRHGGCESRFAVAGGDIRNGIGSVDGPGDATVVAFGADLKPCYDNRK